MQGYGWQFVVSSFARELLLVGGLVLVLLEPLREKSVLVSRKTVQQKVRQTYRHGILESAFERDDGLVS